MGNVLQGRTFGLPNVVLIGGAAVLIWFLFLRGKAASPSGAQGASQQTTAGYSLGYAQGLQSAAPAPPPSSSAPSASSLRAGSGNPALKGPPWNGSSIPLYADPGSSNVSGFIPWDTPLQQDTGRQPRPAAGPWQGQGITAIPVTYLNGWVHSTDVSGGGGVGGPARKHHIGSRSSHLWHDGHPLIGAPVQLPHYVRKVGGPSKTAAHHQAEVHRVARQAGVHPARIMQLNPRASSAFIRVA